MPVYDPITDIVPVASMVTGLAMPSALGAQIRDDLVALYDGVWFRATGAGLTLPSSTWTPVPMDTITMSDTATDSVSISLVSGLVQTSLAGHWWIGGQFTVNTAATIGMALETTDAPVYVAETLSDTASTKTEISASAIVEVTSTPNTFTLIAYSTSTPAITDNSYSPLLWGCWLGELA